MIPDDPTVIYQKPKKVMGYLVDERKKLTHRQKEIAELLTMGYRKRELANRFQINYGQIYAWSINPRFMRYQQRLEDDIRRAMEKKTFSLLDLCIVTLEKMLKGGNPDSQKFAIETVFRLNGKYQDKNNNGNPVSAGMQVNVMATQVDIGQLDPSKKEKVKELLSITRGAEPVKPETS